MFEVKPFIFDKSKFTVVGNPTITDDGVASGFSVNNYIKTPNVSELSKITESLKFTSSFVYNTLSSEQTIWNKNLNFDLRLVNSSIILRTYDGSKSNAFSILQSQHKVANGEQVFCDVVITPNLCRIKINGVEYTKKQVTDFSYLINAADKSFLIGMSNAFNFYFHTSIDLSQFSITVDGKEVFSGVKENPIYNLVNYYSDLLILQYHDKPKAIATIQLFVQQFIADGLFDEILDSYDLDIAVGVQLDRIGNLVGCPRYVVGVGVLDDDDYRVLIKFKIVLNSLSAKEKSIDDALYTNFGNNFIAINEKTMNMSFVVSENLNKVLQAVLKLNYLPLPLGVGNGGVIQVPDTQKIFGFANEPNNVGFSTADELGEGEFLSKDNIMNV